MASQRTTIRGDHEQNVGSGRDRAIDQNRRSGGGDRKSFPSGHAALAFAAAATLENRHGWQAGAPAFVLAPFVGVARVEGRRHDRYDAVAGGAIGTASGLRVTSRRNHHARLVPWAEAGGGVALSMRF